MSKFVFEIKTKLPLLSECLLAIIDFAPTHNTPKQNNCISTIVNQLHNVWANIFGESNLYSKSNTRKILKNTVSEYETIRKNGIKSEKVRHFLKNHAQLFDLLANTGSLDETLLKFYQDQISTRIYSINSIQIIKSPDQSSLEFLDSDGIAFTESPDSQNQGYLSQGHESQDHQSQDDNNSIQTIGQECQSSSKSSNSDKIFLEEQQSLDDNNRIINNFDERCLDQKVLKNGFVYEYSPFLKKDATTQTDELENSYTPHIRKKRKFIPKIKRALALACVDAGITPNQSRKAFKSFAKNFYGQIFYLDEAEFDAVNFNSDCVELIDREVEEPPSKRPRSAKDFSKFAHILPSPQVVSDEKHNLAIVREGDAAKALLEKPEKSKATLHYDSTTRAKIQGEWTSLILEFSDGRVFDLKPLTMAIENSENIANFFVEELTRLSVIAKVRVTDIWEAVDSLMTDSVAKNLGTV
jgi:hypothetical protein